MATRRMVERWRGDGGVCLCASGWVGRSVRCQFRGDDKRGFGTDGACLGRSRAGGELRLGLFVEAGYLCVRSPLQVHGSPFLAKKIAAHTSTVRAEHEAVERDAHNHLMALKVHARYHDIA